MIDLVDVSKVYRRDDGHHVCALREVTLTVGAGEFVVVRGPSGSGKSSLLNILGCLDTPTSGTYRLAGEDLAGYADARRSRLRGRHIGFVFQSFNLLPRTTALENVELAMTYGHGRVDRIKALAALDRVGLADRARHYPSELSGGEQQRVAVARALINDPPLILADEPTGNLDSVAGSAVMRLLEAVHADGRTVLVVTHGAVPARAARQVTLCDGRIASDTLVSSERQ